MNVGKSAEMCAIWSDYYNEYRRNKGLTWQERLYKEIMKPTPVDVIPFDVEETIDFIVSIQNDTKALDRVLRFYRDGVENRVIAKEYGVSEGSVSQSKSTLFSRLRNGHTGFILDNGLQAYNMLIQCIKDRGSEDKWYDKLKSAEKSGDLGIVQFMIHVCIYLSRGLKGVDINVLDISNDTYNSLSRSDIRTIYDLIKTEDLLQVRGIGKKGVIRIDECLKELGIGGIVK